MPESKGFLVVKRIIFILLVIILSLIYRETRPVTGGMSDYCYVPANISQTVPPNVLLIIDVSGSMDWCAYNPESDKTGCCSDPNGCGWTYREDEEGYFEPDAVYEYKEVSVGSIRKVYAWVKSSETTYALCPKLASDIDTTKKYKGSCLNFHYMRRIDLVRWALTGGTLASCPTDVDVNNPQSQFKSCNPMAYGQAGDQTSCNGTGCLLKTLLLIYDPYREEYVYVYVYVFASWERITGTEGGILFQFKRFNPQPRVGLMEYAYDYWTTNYIRRSKVYIGDFVASANYDALNPYKNVITSINVEDPYGATPTGPVLWDAYNYFSQRDPQFGGFSPQRGAGDEWKNYMYQCDDKNRDGNCQGNEFIFVPCAKNFIILLSDGQWNTGASDYTCSIDDGFEASSADPVVPAYWLHKKGFYNQAANNTYSYIEAIYAIGFYLGGTGEKSLKNVAMYGAFDRSKTWPDGLSGYPKATCGPIDDCCNWVNCGKGSSCTDLPPSSSDWDADRNGIPDTFYSANNAKELKDSILNAILDILRRASSGATVATLSQRYTAGSLLFQPYFYPGTNGTEFASWIGFLKALWIDAKGRFREETERNFILNLLRDYWVQFVTEGNSTTYFKITNDTTCSYLQVDRIEDISHIFESGCLLAKSPPENRKIYVNFNGNMVSFESGTPSLLNYLQSLWSSSAGESVNATCLLEYIRGKDRACNSTYVLRPRTVDLGTYCLGESGKATWKLGDIFFSTPVVISNRPLNTYHLRYYDQSYLEYLRSDSYRRRNNYIFVGANDGMLHVFRAGWMQFYRPPDEPLRLIDAFNLTTTDLIGKEEWAFIPQDALPYLVWYGHKDYCHIPLIDYKVTLFDAKIKGKWETLLLGMMGFGGKAINADGCPNGKCSSSLFLLKLKFKSDGTFDDPPFELLWEKQLPDNTLTLSYPVILKYSNGSDWSQSYIVLGSGPKEVTGIGEPYEVEFIATPKIYFINLETGEISKEIPIPGVSNQAVGSLRAVDYDNDYRDDLIYFGTYNLGNGALFRLSLRSTNGAYKDISSLSSSDITQVLSDLNRPVFASPELTVDSSGALWVIFGTGVYFEKSIIDYTNYFVGLKDFCKFGNCTYSFSQLTDRTNYCGNKANYISLLIFNATEQTCKCNSSSGCSNFNETTTLFKFNYTDYPALGWYHLLRTNERMYSTPIVLQGMVNTLSFLPNTDPCSRGGETYYYMVCYQEGCPCYNMRGEEAPVVSKFFGIGAPPIGQPFQVLKTTKGTMIISQTSGGPPSVAPKPQIQPQGIFILWQEK